MKRFGFKIYSRKSAARSCKQGQSLRNALLVLIAWDNVALYVETRPGTRDYASACGLRPFLGVAVIHLVPSPPATSLIAKLKLPVQSFCLVTFVQSVTMLQQSKEQS